MSFNSHSMTRTSAPQQRTMRARQRGVVLLIALVAVFMLMLAGLATLRSVDTTTLLTGNLAFREAAVQSADYGIEQARAWLINSSQTPSNLFQDVSAQGYTSVWDDSFDPKTFDWSNGSASTRAPIVVHQVGDADGATGPAGFDVRYVIHRMCRLGNGTSFNYVAPPGQTTQVCYLANFNDPLDQSKGQGGIGADLTPSQTSSEPYYRITTRVVGPRNSVSYVQAMVY